MDSVEVDLQATATQDEVHAAVEALNADDGVDGILIQVPLPEHLDEAAVMRRLDPAKDVDGLHPQNAGELLLGGTCLTACTPQGIMKILERF